MTSTVTPAEVAELTDCPDPDACESTVTICECGTLICTRHTPDVIDCVIVGAHHERCQMDCGECAAADAWDNACGEAS